MNKEAEKNASSLSNALLSFRSGNIRDAERHLAVFISLKFGLELDNLTIREDSLSLNSINGTFDVVGGDKLFFKFHMEESEDTVQEYYRAELLSNAGYPVEKPLYISKDVGEQILIYPYKNSERLADMCRRLDVEQDINSEECQNLITAQKNLDIICADKSIETLKTSTPKNLQEEPLLQLFYWRLVDKQEDDTVIAGGRYKSFYVDQDFEFPDEQTLSYDTLAKLQWNINGINYPITIEQAFQQARKLLAPDYYSEYAACTAHGDAHNGNVWANKTPDEKIDLTWFDPAFAGEHIPVLLADVKHLFHNIFAHPDWLYNSKEAHPHLKATCEIEGNKIIVDHDWQLTDLRKAFLETKLEYFWIPVLKEINRRGQLPPDWEEYVRSALFCCPTLVMNLRANAGTEQNSHTPKTSLLGLSISIMLASAPDNGQDIVADFFNELRASI